MITKGPKKRLFKVMMHLPRKKKTVTLLFKVNNILVEKMKNFLKNCRSQKLSTRMGAKSQMIQFAKEDLNLKRRLLEQLEKSDIDFNQNITKVGRTVDTTFFFF